MSLASVATAIAVGVGTNLITNKILGDPDMPKQIGSGTAPSLTPGPETAIQEIMGSDVQDFNEFTSTDFSKPSQDEQDKIMQELQNVGISPEELKKFGIPGMYLGGLLKKMSAGGGIGSIMDLSSIEIPDLLSMVELPEFQLDPDDIDIPVPQLSMYEKLLARYGNLDPIVQEAVMEGIGSIGTAALMKAFGDDDEAPMSRVSTNTLPPAGNANRRRLQFDPIGMEEGGVLDRKMFKPMLDGGELDGPGGPKDDLIPIMASDGEFMLSKATVDLVGKGDHSKGIATLEKLNNKGNKVYG